MSLSPPAGDRYRPRVVLFRANSIDSDSRAKKFSLTLARLGYDVVVLSGEDLEASRVERRLGAVRVVPVPLTRAQRDLQLLKVGARRRRQFRIIDWTPTDEYVTQVRELKRWARGIRRRADRWRYPPEGTARSAGWFPLWFFWRSAFVGAVGVRRLRMLRWRAQWALNVGYRLGWREWDRRKSRTSLFATTRGMLPEVEDYATSFGRVLDDLQPDIIHAHHPAVLGTAVRAARRRRAHSGRCLVIYDAREDFLGIPHQEQGHWRRHAVLVREEARYIRAADAVMTVSEPIAGTLQARYSLPVTPATVLNVPVDGESLRPGQGDGPTVREAAGLTAGVPLLVYSGAVSRARGIDVLVRALVHCPGVHAVVVPVPFPHPHQGELTALAAELGVADRLHFCPPVGQDELLHYLSGADVGVMPLRTGSANIDQALPNKLFENLHAGLTMVTSDARLMREFVTDHDLGEVYHDPDPVDLAAAVTRALANPRDTAGARWEALRHRYSWQGQEQTIRDFYGALVPAPTPEGIGDHRFPSLTVSAAGAEPAHHRDVSLDMLGETLDELDPDDPLVAGTVTGPSSVQGRQL